MMINYRPTAFRAPRMAQEAAATPAGPRYTGVPGAIETLAVLAMAGAATWVGVRTGMREKGLLQLAGYVGGLGSGLLGLLYLGERSGVSQPMGLPGVRVT